MDSPVLSNLGGLKLDNSINLVANKMIGEAAIKVTEKPGNRA